MEFAFPEPAPVVVISASIGAGHDGAAAEITRRLRTSGSAVRRADFLDLFPAGWGRALQQTYARQLAYGPHPDATPELLPNTAALDVDSLSEHGL